MYRPGVLPIGVEELRSFLAQELRNIADGMGQPTLSYALLETHHAPPARLMEGMVVLADGTNWDPGSGAGVYCRYGGAWSRLG